MLNYLAKCEGDCTKAEKESLKFFKLDGAGVLDAASNQWASDKLIGKYSQAYHEPFQD